MSAYGHEVQPALSQHAAVYRPLRPCSWWAWGQGGRGSGPEGWLYVSAVCLCASLPVPAS
eukprot:45024-Eustigmatos_ZCMA.PRE.1